MECLEDYFPRMPMMRPAASVAASADAATRSGDALFENPHAILIPWRGRIEMEALDLWKGLDASAHTDTRFAGWPEWWVHAWPCTLMPCISITPALDLPFPPLIVLSIEGVFSLAHRALVLEHLNVPLPAKAPSIMVDGRPAPPFYSVATTPR